MGMLTKVSVPKLKTTRKHIVIIIFVLIIVTGNGGRNLAGFESPQHGRGQSEDTALQERVSPLYRECFVCVCVMEVCL